MFVARSGNARGRILGIREDAASRACARNRRVRQDVKLDVESMEYSQRPWQTEVAMSRKKLEGMEKERQGGGELWKCRNGRK